MGGGTISSSNNLPVSGSYYASPTKSCCSGSSCCCSDNGKTCRDLVALNPNEDITPTGSFSSSVLGPVPSQSEVELAISVLKDFIHAVSSSNGSESKWVIQILDSPTSRLLVSYGLGRVYEAFQLLQLDPSFKRLVVSLASDKALWDAIMNNELVRKFGEPRSAAAENGSRKSASEEPELAARILQWLYEIAKAKLIELAEKFRSLVNEIFQHGGIEKLSAVEDLEENLRDKVRSSLLLSVVILVIVVVARANHG